MNRNDPENYARLSKPFESREALNQAFSDFTEAAKKLRDKIKIPDVLLVLSASAKTGNEKGEDGVGTFLIVANFGDAAKAEGLAAMAYGQTKAEREEAIARFLKGGTRK